MILQKTFYKQNQIVLTKDNNFLHLMEYQGVKKKSHEEQWVTYDGITKQISLSWLKVPYANKNS